MIKYISQHLPTGTFEECSGKREANSLLSDPDWRVWVVEGRKGDQLNKKLVALYKSLGNNELPPTWAASLHWKEKQTRTRSAEHNEKISKAMAGKPKTEEHKQAIRDAMIGNSNRR